MELPVATDVLVYTQAEWEALVSRPRRFGQTLLRETIWVYGQEAGSS